MKQTMSAALLACCVVSGWATAATIGIGEVTALESLVGKKKDFEDQVQQRFDELRDLRSEKMARAVKLRAELSRLVEERDKILAELKSGLFCSQCKRSKTEIEKEEHEDFYAHLKTVKGVAIEVPSERFESIRAKYSKQILDVNVALSRIDDQFAQRIEKKEAELREAEARKKTICDTATQHSREYERILAEDTRSRHRQRVARLIEYATNILIAADTLELSKAAKKRAQKDFDERLRELQERQTSNLDDDDRKALDGLKRDIAEKRDKAMAEYAAREKKLAADVDDRQAKYMVKEHEATRENFDYFDMVASESNRIVIAGQALSCPVANNARQFVAGNWNKVRQCVSSVTAFAKNRSSVFNSYCPAEVGGGAFSTYRNYLRNLKDTELDTIRRTSNSTWMTRVLESE